jgi:hypothetical protein
MAEDGWVTHREEREGNRPPRRVYAITPQGESAFQRLLRQSLAHYHPLDFTWQIGLAFLDELSAAEALPMLHRRRAATEAVLGSTRAQCEHPGSLQLMLEYQRHLLAAELEWLDGVISRLQEAEYVTGRQGGRGS